MRKQVMWRSVQIRTHITLLYEENKKKLILICFCTLFIVSILVLGIINNTDIYYDSDFYWTLGKTCGWNVRNLESGFRGYVLPYIFSISYKIGELFNIEFWGYRILSSTTFAFMFTYIYMKISEILGVKDSYMKIDILGGLVSGIIFWFFFRGLFIYPLSDVYALCFSLVSIIILYDIINKEEKLYVKALKSFVLGLILYGTYNIRTIYLFSLIACCIVLVV